MHQSGGPRAFALEELYGRGCSCGAYSLMRNVGAQKQHHCGSKIDITSRFTYRELSSISNTLLHTPGALVIAHVVWRRNLGRWARDVPAVG